MKKEISVVAILVLFVAIALLGLFAPVVMGKSEYLKDISDEYEALYREKVEILMKYVEQAENAYDSGRREAYAGLTREIEKECNLYVIIELTLIPKGYCGSEKIKEAGEELSRACFGEGYSLGGFGRAAHLAQYEGVYAYSYDPEASYEALQQGKAHLEKAESLLPREKVPGFNAIAAIAGLLFAVYLISSRRKK